MPPPIPLRISPEPWLRADISPGLAHILSAPDALQARQTVAVVDDVCMESNLALFMGAAAVWRDAWALLDALDAVQFTAIVGRHRLAAALRASLIRSAA